MERYPDVALPTTDSAHSVEAAGFLTTVYMWMFAGLALTTVVAWTVVETPYLDFVFNRTIFYGLLIGELLLVVVLSAAIGKISSSVATGLFLLYSALNGLTLSIILLVYTGESIMMAFLSAGCLFGTMSIYGYATKRDLTGWGSILFVGLIAVIICTIINLLLGSDRFTFIISIVGVVVFLGLTAYDTQKILKIGAQTAGGDAGLLRKAAIMGALALYLDFINLFLYMLRFMGKRK